MSLLKVALIFFLLTTGFTTLSWARSKKTTLQKMDPLIANLDTSEPFIGPLHEVKSSSFDKWPSRVFIDPDLDSVTVTRDPGKSWRDCQKESEQCVAWPRGDADIERVTSAPVMEHQELNIATSEIEKIQFVKVRYKYTRPFQKQDGTTGDLDQQGEGWIDSRVLRSEKMLPLYKEERPLQSASQKKEPRKKKSDECPPKRPQQNNLNDIADLNRYLSQTPNQQLNAAVDALRPIVGQCPLDPPHQKRLERWNSKPIYDVEVLPRLQAIKNKIPIVPKQSKANGPIENATFQDVVAVDALARTIYSEMNECFKMGVQYPMAAAKVAMNRAKLVERGTAPAHFVGSRHKPEKPTIAKVVTAPYQFSVWNRSEAAQPRNKTILMSLCPSRDESKKNWTGSRPGPDDRAAWNLAFKIASEAVLFPPRFEAKTKEVTQTYYTSKMDAYDGRNRPHPAPRIEGRPVESYRCMYVWNGN